MTLDPVEEYKWLQGQLSHQLPKNPEMQEALRKLFAEPASRKKILRHVKRELEEWANRETANSGWPIEVWLNGVTPRMGFSRIFVAVDYRHGCFVVDLEQRVCGNWRLAGLFAVGRNIGAVKKQLRTIIRDEFGCMFDPGKD